MTLQWPPTGLSVPHDTYAGYKVAAFSGEDASSLLRLSTYRTHGFFAVKDKPTFPNHGDIIIKPGPLTGTNPFTGLTVPLYLNLSYLDTEDGHLDESNSPFTAPPAQTRRHTYLYNAGMLAHSPAWDNTSAITDTEIVRPSGLVVNYAGGVSPPFAGITNAQGIPPTEAGSCLFYSPNVIGFSLFSESGRSFYDSHGILCPQFPNSTAGRTFPTSIIPVPNALTVPYSFGVIHGINSQIHLSVLDKSAGMSGNDPDGSYRENTSGLWGYANGELIQPGVWNEAITGGLGIAWPQLGDLFSGARAIEGTPDPAADIPVQWGPPPRITVSSNEMLFLLGQGYSLIYQGGAPFEFWNPDHPANKIIGSGTTKGKKADCTPYMPTQIKMRFEQLHVHHADFDGSGNPQHITDVDVDYWTPDTIYYIYLEETDPNNNGNGPPNNGGNGSGINPASLRQRELRLHGKLIVGGSGVVFNGMDVASPYPQWDRSQRPVASSTTVQNVHGSYDTRGMLYALYDEIDNLDAQVKEARSGDDGLTWEATDFMFSTAPHGVKQPRIVDTADGSLLRCAFALDAPIHHTSPPGPDTPAPTGKIIAVLQESGDVIDDMSNPLQEYYFRDDSGDSYETSADIKIADTGYDITAPGEFPGRWFASWQQVGGTGTTDFSSGDGKTWSAIPTSTVGP